MTIQVVAGHILFHFVIWALWSICRLPATNIYHFQPASLAGLAELEKVEQLKWSRLLFSLAASPSPPGRMLLHHAPSWLARRRGLAARLAAVLLADHSKFLEADVCMFVCGCTLYDYICCIG